jgi:hypothetical protein
MGKTTSRELLKARAAAWFKKMADIVATLHANPWWKPLMAAQTKENSFRDAELVSKVEWPKENQERWTVWRCDLRRLLVDCHGYVNDCASERMPQLANNLLFQIASLPDSAEGFCARESYLKEHCLADLQRVGDLVKSVGRFPRPSRKVLPEICKKLKLARGTDTEVQAAAAITEILKRLGSPRKKPLGQPEYHRWETGRVPSGTNLAACKDYINQKARRSPKK